MNNKARFKEAKEKMNEMDFINEVHVLEEILKEYQGISSNSKAVKYVENDFMPSKIGNLKIGNDTIIINVNHALNCYSSKNGYCEHCKDCYAKQSSNMYKNSFLYGLASEICFNRLSVSEIIKSIETENKKELKKNEIRFIRFNEAGDFKNYDLFLKANKIAKYFFDKYGIISYTYTHNKELIKYKDEIKDSYIVMNWSIKGGYGFKSAITCNNPSDLKKYLSDDNYVICTGKCYHCSYCKDRNDLRTVVFVNHATKTIEEGLKAGLSVESINKLKSQKFIDYGNFLMKLSNYGFLI